MKKVIFTILFVLFIQDILYAQEIKGKAIMGYLVDGLDDIKYKDARIAFSLWIKDLSIEESLDVSVKYFDTEDEIIKGYTNQDFGYLALNPYFYLKNYQSIDLISKDYWITSRGKKKLENRVLLVKKGSGIKSIKDLKDKTIMLRNDDYIGRMFLDKESLEKLHVSSIKHLGEIQKTKKYSTSMLKTFFSKTDACVVPAYAFELVKEMNPSVGEHLVPLLQTEDIFLSAMGIFHKDTEVWMAEAFKRNIVKLDTTPKGQNILALFKMHSMSKLEYKELSPIKEYYKKYLDLKNKYKVKG